MNNLGTVQIETERLILRRLVRGDAEAVFSNWASDTEVTKYLTWQAHASVKVTKAIIAEWIKAYKKLDFYQWAVVPKDFNQPVGTVSAVSVDPVINAVQTGYCFGKAWWGKGYATEALSAVIKFFFESVKVGRIFAIHDVNNPNSGKVMQKAGMVFEGIMRKGAKNNQGIIDAAQYAIISEDNTVNR